MRRIASRLDPVLHAALTATAASEKSSHGHVVLDCVEAAHNAGVLTDLVAAGTASPQPGGLFPRLKGRGPAQPAGPVEIRLHAHAVTILDQLVDETAAESRTQLIVAALRHRLPEPAAVQQQRGSGLLRLSCCCAPTSGGCPPPG